MLNSKTRKEITKRVLSTMDECLKNIGGHGEGEDFLVDNAAFWNDDELNPELVLDLLPGAPLDIATGEVAVRLIQNGNVRFSQETTLNPALVMLRSEISATGAILFRDESRPEGDQWVRQFLGSSQQAIVNRFCREQVNTMQSVVLEEYDFDCDDCEDCDECESRENGGDFGPADLGPADLGPAGAGMFEAMRMVSTAMFGANVPDGIGMVDVMNAVNLSGNGQAFACESESNTGKLVTIATLLARAAAALESFMAHAPELGRNQADSDRLAGLYRHIHENVGDLGMLNMATIATLMGEEDRITSEMENSIRRVIEESHDQD